MKINVTFFARARDLAGVTALELELPDGSTVADLRTALAEKSAALRPLLPSLFIAVGTNYAENGTQLAPGAEIACFPPVSGG
jgi:molybdopterin converting factor subunit 1